MVAEQIARHAAILGWKTAILQMKHNNYPHWRQMEWIGFYFQYLCEKHLSPTMRVPGPSYGRVEFDGFLHIPWDFKSHAMNHSRHSLIVNDRGAIEKAITQYGSVGVIVALGNAEYNDLDRSFQRWHQELKGKVSKYEKKRIARGAPSRLRKVSFTLQQIMIIRIGKQTLQDADSFQGGFRNANGRPRREKVLLNLKRVQDSLLRVVEFS